ncbi:amino acid adenylation domain-containing protein [Actinophytocola sp.]|uniref:amino acid adenylation domain-containing protein n=1 Tax=Actinophytocola sp. TaxID=1872138 RepID=UPI002ED4A619
MAVLSGDACLPDLLREQVRAHPERTAVSFRGESLTFLELETRIAELASYLQDLGVGEDDFVGLFLEPSVETVVGAWGVLAAGGAYLPLSPEYPEDRLRYMVEDARPKVILTQDGLVERLAELAPAGTRVVTPRDVAGRGAVVGGPRPDGLAYVVYTSGSTGKPKGVLVEHRSVVNQLRWLADTYQLDEHSTILLKTPMSFDAAQWEILAPAFGSRVVVGAPGIHRDPELVIDTVNEYGVTTLQCVPTLLQALVDTERLHTSTSLTRIFSGGEALSRTLAQQTLAELPSAELVNLYGPTECTINSSAFTVDRDQLAEGPDTISIGTPVADTEYHILDENHVPVGVGEVGELYIGGVQLARGYLNQPQLTAERFIDHPTAGRLYRTGDRVYWNADGTVQYAGRADNQVKLRGFRVELDEIRHAVEAHDWVRNAAVVVKRDPHTGFQNLIACVELNPREAALMDQGNHGAHHQSKQSRLQVKAQLSNPGCRDDLRGRHVLDLPGRVPTERQRQRVFARKTYRFYEGGDVTKSDLLRLLARQVPATGAREPGDLNLEELGEIIRYFGQFHSDERLLPKYGYASPGALYATQLYLELDGVAGLRSGFYYYHPVSHQLVLIRAKTGTPGRSGARLHLVGRKSAIEPVYKNNIQEVLEIEAGHLVGLLEEILPEYGMDVTAAEPAPSIMDRLEVAAEDYYLGTFDVVPNAGHRPDENVEIYVQSHPGRIVDLPAGQYRYENGDLRLVSAELVSRKHVIAINQQAYERSSFGVTVLSRNQREALRYVDLGRTLQRLMMNDSGLGFMSSGYSSKTGHDLPSHRRIDAVLGGVAAPSYFFVGGRVSEEQLRSTGMKEDAVHMKGPTELIKDDLATFLPDYMMPNKVVVLDALPLTANGKIDVQALERSTLTDVGRGDRPFVAPTTPTEVRIAAIWGKLLRRDTVSVTDDFFESGGNSLIAVGLVNRVNKEFGTALPLQVLFAAPTVQKLAGRVERGGSASRLVRLAASGQSARPVFCWPGLGGFTMNLRQLAAHNGLGRPFYGVQAHGVNEDETPYATIEEMAAADVAAIRRVQPTGPYTLWGYSFGARVAFETAYQLEQAGERVEHLFLIAPGSPILDVAGSGEPSYQDRAFVTILFSVFAGGIDHPALTECLRVAEDDESFTGFVADTFDLDPDLVRRITGVVRRTYGFRYEFHELARRKVNAPITIFKAQGDDYSFIENSSGYSAEPPAVVELDADHYELLTGPGLGELVSSIQQRLPVDTKETVVPHVSIKHFPTALSAERQEELVAAVTKAVTSAFQCDEGVISIALEPVEKERWTDQVYIPEIVNRKDLLRKSPNY